MMEDSNQDQEKKKKKKGILQEKVHDLYFKVFPGSDCPVTGSAREKLIEASARSQQKKEEEEKPKKEKEEEEEDQKKRYKHPHVYDVYGRRIDNQNSERNEVWRMPSFLYKPSLIPNVPDPDLSRRSNKLDPTSRSRAFDDREPINPANRMPLHPNQDPSPGQKENLSTFRQKSTIPKAGTDETWLYPSPQMFYNSLVRKKKADDVTEKDMDAVVATHNTVNEATWSRLLQWERLYGEMYPDKADEDPRLLYFRGRPHDLTPKAAVKKFLGYGVPFDRHDWTVDRGGREMRYVIDFYYDESKEWPFFVDVRPALDSPMAALLRARMMMRELVHSPASHVEEASKNADSHTSPT